MDKIGRFEVVRPLGRGGMGQVFLARDPTLERQVALKLLSIDDGPSARGLFESEAKALAALSHPNIVTIFEIAEFEGRQFIAMEYLPGRSLRELLLHDPPSREALLAICAQVALALAAAHDAGILHRDIKPENVMVGKAAAVKVVDFGIARRLDTPSFEPSTRSDRRSARTDARAAQLVDMFTRTLPVDTGDGAHALPSAAATVETAGVTAMTRTVFGTPAYMAPEVLMGQPTSPASDVYSLGVMLFEGLTGHRPYEAPNLHEVIARVIDGSEHPKRIDDPLGELVEQMIDRDPARRPTPAAIAKALAPQQPPARRSWRWLVPVLATAAVGAATIAIITSRAPAPASADAPVIAIQEVAVSTVQSYGALPPNTRSLGRVLKVLVEATGVSAIGPEVLRPGDQVSEQDPAASKVTDAEWEDAARKSTATRLVRCAVVEHEGALQASCTLLDLTNPGHTTATATLTGDPNHLADLMRRLAGAIATTVRRGATLGKNKNRQLAITLTDIGTRPFGLGRWFESRPYFEQAVDADPTFAEAWDKLTTIHSYTGPPHDIVLETLEHAVAIATGTRRQILHARLLHAQRRYVAELAELAPLEHAELADADKLDVLYQLGEGHWHEGRHDLGYEYFGRVLKLAPNYTLAAKHAGEYAIARRMEEPAKVFLGVQQARTDYIEFALQHYEALARSDAYPFNIWSQLILEQPSSHQGPEPSPHDADLEALAAASGNGDLETMRHAFAATLDFIRARPKTGATSAHLAEIAELVICAGLADETREVLAMMRSLDATGYYYQRLALVAAPMLGMPALDRGLLTERLHRLAEAMDAELAGDRAKAAELLGRLVHDPTFEWDYPERVALVRNLRALGRTHEADQICDDTIHPAVMRFAYRAARRFCRGH